MILSNSPKPNPTRGLGHACLYCTNCNKAKRPKKSPHCSIESPYHTHIAAQILGIRHRTGHLRQTAPRPQQQTKAGRPSSLQTAHHRRARKARRRQAHGRRHPYHCRSRIQCPLQTQQQPVSFIAPYRHELDNRPQPPSTGRPGSARRF